MVLETDCVTGNGARGYDTPEGVYGITYKQRNATLNGENYSTPVDYWMPFNKILDYMMPAGEVHLEVNCTRQAVHMDV